MIRPILLLSLLAAAPPAVPAIPVETRIASRVERASALETVRALVQLGPRMGGTRSGDRAAALVATRMKALGLETEVVEDPPLAAHEERGWAVRLDGRKLRSAWPHGFSPSLAGTTALLVEDAPGRALPPGRIVLTDRPVREVYERLAGSGAVAILSDHPRDPSRYPSAAPVGALPFRAGAPPKVAAFGVSVEDGRLLREALAAGGSGGARVTVMLDATTREGRPRTVIGTLPGAGETATGILIVCAHGDSDSGGPGADDNASGVATLLEVARALAGARDDGLLPASRPAIRFIVWGTEIHSTRAWLTGRPDEARRIVAVINYDETGIGADRDAVYYEGNDVPFNAPLLRIIEQVALDHAGADGFPPVYTSVPSLGGADAHVFLPRRHRGDGLVDREIPATTLFTAAWDRSVRLPQTAGWASPGWPEPDLLIDHSPYYHSSGDTPANTTEKEPWNMERCARLGAAAIYRLMLTGTPAPARPPPPGE